ncbi:energy transducer TonB [Undibacterium oligocarboniphilum]|uniref:TonB family protein n=1 Tax=Undibacterium oligocarboniphilum TaxID=666702 RepID=A0A850QN06_9BURK|nr:energy transducer TonB [Undibacterium oligocarboniphilum]MBC3869840.1 TonB family protein [Undibacterium oligocarboniphilum]NVO77456.1 TonB family protein [Undibacterium oligocarboniphilum]
MGHLMLIIALQNILLPATAPAAPKEIVMAVLTPPPPPAATVATQRASQPLTPAVPDTVLAESSPVNITPAPETAFVPPAITVIAPATAPAITETTHGIAAHPAPPAIRQISEVQYIRAPQAEYPPMAKRMGEQGKVTLTVLVNEKGYAERVDIQKTSGSQRLDEAARQALMRAVFKPYVEDGKPLPVMASATISFSLDT